MRPVTPDKLFKSIDHRLNGGAKEKHTGFALLVFPFHEPTTKAAYMANCDRAALLAIINTLREELLKQEESAVSRSFN